MLMQVESESLTATMLTLNGTVCSRVTITSNAVLTAAMLVDPTKLVNVWATPDVVQKAMAVGKIL